MPSERKSKRAPKKTKKGSILERALKAKKDGKIGKKTKGKKKAKVTLIIIFTNRAREMLSGFANVNEIN